jgi:hypothetical protein
MFFVPSSEITKQLIQKVGKRRSDILRSAVVQSTETPEEGLAESDELLTSVLTALEDEEQRSPESDWEDRRWLAEMIYHFMGRVAHRNRREAANRFSLTQCMVEGMGVRLGLREPDDAEVLNELAGEFSAWLAQQKVFIAGWGKILASSNDPDALIFKPLERHAGLAVAVNDSTESSVSQATSKVDTAMSVEVERDLVES